MGPIKYFDPSPRESQLERWLVGFVKKLGGRAYKFVSPGHRSVPDRIIFFPKHPVFLMELKRRGKKPTPKQWNEILFFRGIMGVATYVCDSKESIKMALIEEGVF